MKFLLQQKWVCAFSLFQSWSLQKYIKHSGRSESNYNICTTHTHTHTHTHTSTGIHPSFISGERVLNTGLEIGFGHGKIVKFKENFYNVEFCARIGEKKKPSPIYAWIDPCLIAFYKGPKQDNEFESTKK